MVMERGIPNPIAATWIALFYLGITVGRFVSGFLSMKISDKNMVRLGEGIAVAGIVFLLLTFNHQIMLLGFILIGLGCAPIYPSLLHATPDHFGKELSQAIMGLQMAFAYIGSTFSPLVAGFIVEHISIKLFPLLLLFYVGLMIAMSEYNNHRKKNLRPINE